MDEPPEPVWTLWRKENSLALAGNRTPSSPHPVAISTELSHFLLKYRSLKKKKKKDGQNLQLISTEMHTVCLKNFNVALKNVSKL
jgi:hypothetical protein